jgi:hypothetical protein
MEDWMHLPIAVRAHTVRTDGKATTPRARRRHQEADWEASWPDLVLVIDCETTIDSSQRLTFGCYRVLDGEHLIEEGLFIGNDLSDADRANIEAYARTHLQQNEGKRSLIVRSREAFLREVFFPIAYDAQGVVVGFNLPFDLSRLACDVGLARGRYKGGFSFSYLTYTDAQGIERPDNLVPRIAVKALDSKRALIGLTSAWKKRDPRQVKGGKRRSWRGHFLDLRTLTFALTGTASTLDGACRAFGITDLKQTVAEHGKVTTDYIDYARQDVRITADLYGRVLSEYRLHPLPLAPDRAYSPASIGKAYLKAMGVTVPKLVPHPALGISTDEVLGFAMESYYGGRAECRVRKVPVPISYCDFRSMYPSVNTLMGLWRFLTAQRLEVIDATTETRGFLEHTTAGGCFRLETWRELAVLVEVEPDNDVLPVRAAYSSEQAGFTIGVNPLLPAERVEAVWYTLADCLVAKIITGRPPKIRRALRLVPKGRQRTLRPVELRGQVTIDPRTDDFFREVIRARGRVKSDTSLPTAEQNALSLFLKTLANATSYGVFVELNRQDGEQAEVEVFGGEHFTTETEALEDPGAYYFPPLAALITGGARLMLALAEHEVRRRGGTHAFMDTDSIAIVASEQGGLIPCPGGSHQLADRQEDIHALSSVEVEEIRALFAQLDPYGDGGDLLELENENFGEDWLQRELWCLAIAAKRYALFTQDENEVTIHKGTEHGLGAYLPPTDPVTGKAVTDWIDRAWERIARDALGLPALPDLTWLGQLAITRLAISTPQMLGWFRRWNAAHPAKRNGKEKPYPDQVKPFGFLHHAPLAPGLQQAAGSAKHNLVAPYGERRWWVNLHEPEAAPARVVTYQPSPGDSSVLVGRSYADLIAAHPFHPEAKSLGPDGLPCHERTMGLLHRRPVMATEITVIGKEANELEQVESGVVDEFEDVQAIYRQDRSEEVRERLRTMTIKEAMALTRFSRRKVMYLRAGMRPKTHPGSQGE